MERAGALADVWKVVGSRYIVLTSHNKAAMIVVERFYGQLVEYVCFHQEILAVTISCKLRLLLARANVERARHGNPPLSLRRLAGESGVSLSVLAALHTGRSQRIDQAEFVIRLIVYINFLIFIRFAIMRTTIIMLLSANFALYHIRGFKISFLVNVNV